MPTEFALPFPHDRVLYERIGHLIAAMVIRVQQAAPDYLQPKFKAIDLAEKRERLVAKLIGLLSPHADFESVKRLLAGVLQQILMPQFFGTPAYRELLQQIEQLMGPGAGSTYSPQPVSLVKGLDAVDAGAIAVLLLDAENIDIPELAEKWLAQICQYPLQTKIAFANWRKLGNRDQVLHQRGYQMIHVPLGKNGADLKMTALGASMLISAPKVKEVIICSSDSDLDYLKQELASQGLRVYQVRRHREELILSGGSAQTSTFSLTPPIPPIPSVEVPSLAEGLQFLKAHVASQANASILLTHLGTAFHQHFKVSLSQFISHHGYDQKPKAFLESQPEFSVQIVESKQQIWVSFQTPPSQSSPQVSQPQASKDFTPETLRSVSKDILKRLIQEQSTDKVSIGLIASQFHQQYGRTIKSILKQHKLGQKLPNFFKTIKGLQVEWNGKQKQWLASLAD